MDIDSSRYKFARYIPMWLIKFLISFYLLHVKGIERKIGYRIEFPYIPKTYINGLVRFDMGPSWARHEIRALGVNHFTVGSLMEDGISSRYARDKKQYQSWLGAYLVKFIDDKELTPQDHCNLAVADQLNWLEDFGDPNPYIEMSAGHILSSEPIMIGEYQGMLYEFSGDLSHSEVGSKSDNPRSRYLMKVTAALFNKSNPGINIKNDSLIPKNIHSEYETVSLRGWAALLDLEGKNTEVVLYGNTCAIKNEDGVEIDYTSLLKEDILKAFKSVVINEV